MSNETRKLIVNRMWKNGDVKIGDRVAIVTGFGDRAHERLGKVTMIELDNPRGSEVEIEIHTNDGLETMNSAFFSNTIREERDATTRVFLLEKKEVTPAVEDRYIVINITGEMKITCVGTLAHVTNYVAKVDPLYRGNIRIVPESALKPVVLTLKV